MFEPQANSPTFLPSHLARSGPSAPAKDAAQAGSGINFIAAFIIRIEDLSSSSLTLTISSTYFWAIAKEYGIAVGDPSESAMVSTLSIVCGVPVLKLR